MYPSSKSLEFKDFYNEHQAKLKSFLLKRNKKDHNLIDDMLQDIFMAIHPYFHNIENPIRRIQILFGIAKRKLVDHYRRNNRENQLFDKNIDIETLNYQDSMVENDLSDSLFQDAFQKLAESEKLLLNDKYFLRKSVREIADSLNLSEKAVESKLTRSREKLKKLLHQHMSVDITLFLFSLFLALQGLKVK